MALTKSIFLVDREKDYLILNVNRLTTSQLVETIVLRVDSVVMVSHNVETKTLHIYYGQPAPLAFLDVDGLAHRQILKRLENINVPESSGFIQIPKL